MGGVHYFGMLSDWNKDFYAGNVLKTPNSTGSTLLTESTLESINSDLNGDGIKT